MKGPAMIWLGIVLIIVAIGLIVGELFTGSGLLLGLGVAALIFGLVVLFTLGSLLVQINWWLVGPLLVLVIGLIAFIIWRIIRTHHEKVTTGKEDMLGNTAIVKESLDPEGTVLYEGELWNAISSSGKILPGDEVIITAVDRLRFTVTKKEKK
jgi:membrane-bound serine protease (ClpP class)